MHNTYIGYFRVSTDKQGRSGLGLEAQRAAVEGFVNGVSGRLIDTITEVQSGAKVDREGLDEALLKCKMTGSALVVAKLDRLSRNFSQIAQLLEMTQVRIICADSPNDDPFVLRIKAAVAAEERQKISERTKLALAAKKRAGHKLGNPAFHKVRNKDASKARVVKSDLAKSWRENMRAIIQGIDGFSSMSQAQLARILNDKGYKTRGGNIITQSTVSRVLS